MSSKGEESDGALPRADPRDVLLIRRPVAIEKPAALDQLTDGVATRDDRGQPGVGQSAVDPWRAGVEPSVAQGRGSDEHERALPSAGLDGACSAAAVLAARVCE